MFESKSLFGDFREMGYIWARILAIDQAFKITTCCLNLQRAPSKKLTLSAVLIFVI